MTIDLSTQRLIPLQKTDVKDIMRNILPLKIHQQDCYIVITRTYKARIIRFAFSLYSNFPCRPAASNSVSYFVLQTNFEAINICSLKIKPIQPVVSGCMAGLSETKSGSVMHAQIFQSL